MSEASVKKQNGYIDFILAFEAGELTDNELVVGFQNLIDSGIVWQLQGVYGRLAKKLIASGYCTAK